MTTHTPFTALPTIGRTVTADVQGRTITLSSLAGNRWSITETIGALHIGHDHLVTVNGL